MDIQLDDGVTGSVGSIIGAAMETAGHYIQSDYLDILNAGLASSLGGFLWLLSFIGALFIFTIGGKYKFGLWFLFGPPLFFFLINNRVPSTGANWRFGERIHSQDKVVAATKDVAGDIVVGGGGKEAKVSWFFVQWNNLVSNSVQAFISVIDLAATNSDLNFIQKADLYQGLFRAKVTDPKLQLFTQLSMFSECSTYFNLLRARENQALEPDQRTLIEQRIREWQGDDKKVFNLQEFPDLVSWINDAGHSDKLKQIVGNESTMSCDQLWAFGVQVFKQEATQIVLSMANMGRPEGISLEDSISTLAKKFGMRVDKNDGSISLASDGTDSVMNEDQKVLAMYNEISARLLFEQLSTVNPNLASVSVDRQNPLRKDAENSEMLDVAKSIRLYSAREEWQGKGDFMAAALTLPYIQGMALYFLSLTFPFFAMALVVPGRAQTFLLWMALWVYVKTWDFGFAVVMFIDDVMYALMPHGQPITDDVMTDAGTTFKAMLEVDPTYSVHTYYNIMATCLMAVPVLSAAFVKKGGEAVVDAIQQGFHDFSGRVGTAMASFQGSKLAQGKAAQVDSAIFNAQQQAFGRALSNPAVLSNLFKAAGIEIGNKAGSMPTGNAALAQLNDAVGKMNDAGKDYFRRIAGEQMGFQMQMAAFKESVKPHNLAKTNDMVGLSWNSHGKFLSPPSRIGIMRKESFYNIGGAADGIVNSNINKVAGWAGAQGAQAALRSQVARLGQADGAVSGGSTPVPPANSSSALTGGAANSTPVPPGGPRGSTP